MQKYEEIKFNIPDLDSISKKQIDVHLGLYTGYVKHTNHLIEQIEKLTDEDAGGNAYAIAETKRRFSFEFNGMRMHEYYFKQLEDGKKESTNSDFQNMLAQKYGNFENALLNFKEVAMSRGIGWTILTFDPIAKTPHISWVSDHELGQLAGLPILLALDMWEHAFMVDYTPAQKKEYVDAFFENLNWEVVENRFKEI